MSTRSLVESFRAQGVLLGLRGDQVRYLVESGWTPELRSRLGAERDRILEELRSDADGVRSWRQRAKRELWLAVFSRDLEPDSVWLDDQLEAVEERAAILQFDAGLSRQEAEERSLEAALASVAPAPAADGRAAELFTAVCDLSVPRQSHDVPLRGCHACDGREFLRVAGGPAYFCPRCHPPLPGAERVERWTAPEPSRWEVRCA